MATIEECEQALHKLAGRLASEAGSGKNKSSFTRTLSCAVRDLDVIFGGRLDEGRLLGIHRVENADAQLRLALDSDDLVALVDGELPMASALATGRVKVSGGVLDLLKLKSMF